MEAIYEAAFDIICQQASLAHLDILIAFDIGTHSTRSQRQGVVREEAAIILLSNIHTADLF